ncbi:AAA family ATPase [Gemmatimonas aurantiaca]|uniref:AAA family ATPase n=1 Tax=Gemmatimonas aurantiaca TaxID=173480 RepID=UPI00301DFB4B
MIQSISILNVATFPPKTATTLDDLRQFNYIFGTNGTGKTTISRIVADAAFSTACQCTWQNSQVLETFVLNRDFVDKNFDQMRGVFTLGEKEKDTEDKINTAKANKDKEQEKLDNFTRTLGGEDGSGGKKGELAQLESNTRDKFWVPVEKLKKEKKLVGALTGVMSDKEKCKQKVLSEAEHNKAALKDLADLEKKAETIFGEAPTKQSFYPTIFDSALLGAESNPILKKKIIGKEDVDIAAMINVLGNSDWVRQGLPYYEQNGQICPFCQQYTTEQFAQSLKDYFDEAFENDTKAINDLLAQYAQDAGAIQSIVVGLLAAPGKFLDVETLKAQKAALDQTIAANNLRLDNKKKEPSQVVTLVSLTTVISDITAMIEAANAEVVKHNKMVDNLAAEKQMLTAEVWRYVITELEVDLKQYQKNKQDLEKAIAGIETRIQTAEKRIAETTKEITDLEKSTTSILPTISAINKTLGQFGFDSFSLADAGDGMHYKLVRADGSDAKKTISEGEKTFVVFLYFYHLIKGSFSQTGVTTDRVVVFDDPVSSVDSDVLFIVSSLIREVCDSSRSVTGRIKQVFVLTHNVYFHKEVTYNNKRQPDSCLNEESFWVVRKGATHSQCDRHQHNPIKTSYELLWSEVREAENAMQSGGGVSPRIENTLRRILEHYFAILGSIDYKQLCDKFEGADRVMCNSLFSWVNAGSHSALDDAHIAPSDVMARNALRVFKEIFVQSGHEGHYRMMNPPPATAATVA